MEEVTTQELYQLYAELHKLCTSEMEYRKKLLEKYSNIVTRSEGRVDNINHMIGDLLKLSTQCSERFSKEQDNEAKLIGLLEAKDKRIAVLEDSLKKERERYDSLLERYIVNNSKCNENNFNLK